MSDVLEVYLSHGPQDGAICHAPAADTMTGYPDVIRATGQGGAYWPSGETVLVIREDGSEAPMPEYVWEGAA